MSRDVKTMEAEQENSPFLDPGSPELLQDEDDGQLLGIFSKYHEPKKRRTCIGWSVLVVIVVFLLALFFCVGIVIDHFVISGSCDRDSHRDEVCANPPILLVSVDGYWPGYFQRFPQNTSFLRSIGSKGVQAEYMRTVFPSKTFPNHFSIVTGLYPESHGIVSNHFYDKQLMQTFSFSATDPKWWKGEPIWVTAAKHGLRTGVYFWPGSEVKYEGGIRPDFWFHYDGSTPYEERVRMVLSWFDLPEETRPQFMAMYFEEPDHTGHAAGPDSSMVSVALGRVDQTLQSLFTGLEEKGLVDCVNVMIISDHGMGSFNSSRFVYLDDYVPSQYSDSVTYPSLYVNAEININNEDDTILQGVYNALTQNVSRNGAPMQVFKLDDLPLRLHIGHYNKQRYGDIYIAGNIGSFITTRNTGNNTTPGEHGYDNNNAHMHAMFIAHGPAFKKSYSSQPFDNIQLYDLMCALLNITPSANNGSVGSLYHLLQDNVAAKLPPAVAPGGLPGVQGSCPFPQEEETYRSRAFCQDCICNTTAGAHCNTTSLDEANRALNLTDEEMHQSQMRHLPWGVPVGGEGDGSCLLMQRDSVTLYSNALHIPLWAAYRLDAEQVQQADSDEGLCFHSDPRVEPANSANCSNYDSAAGYVRAQLLPARFAGSGLESRLSTSLLTNTVPQLTAFNQTLWSYLDYLVGQWAVAYGRVYVITGSVLDTDHDGMRDQDRNYTMWLNGSGSVAVPSHFFTVVIRCTTSTSGSATDCSASNMEALGVILPHTSPLSDDPTGYIQFRLSTLRDIEMVTGVNFFPSLSNDERNMVELQIVPTLWPTATG